MAEERQDQNSTTVIEVPESNLQLTSIPQLDTSHEIGAPEPLLEIEAHLHSDGGVRNEDVENAAIAVTMSNTHDVLGVISSKLAEIHRRAEQSSPRESGISLPNEENGPDMSGDTVKSTAVELGETIDDVKRYLEAARKKSENWDGVSAPDRSVSAGMVFDAWIKPVTELKDLGRSVEEGIAKAEAEEGNNIDDPAVNVSENSSEREDTAPAADSDGIQTDESNETAVNQETGHIVESMEKMNTVHTLEVQTTPSEAGSAVTNQNGEKESLDLIKAADNKQDEPDDSSSLAETTGRLAEAAAAQADDVLTNRTEMSIDAQPVDSSQKRADGTDSAVPVAVPVIPETQGEHSGQESDSDQNVSTISSPVSGEETSLAKKQEEPSLGSKIRKLFSGF